MLYNKKSVKKILSLVLSSTMPLSQLFCSAATPRDNILKTEKKGLSSKNKKIIGITSAGVVGIPLICISGFYILRHFFTKSTPQQNNASEGEHGRTQLNFADSKKNIVLKSNEHTATFEYEDPFIGLVDYSEKDRSFIDYSEMNTNFVDYSKPANKRLPFDVTYDDSNPEEPIANVNYNSNNGVYEFTLFGDALNLVQTHNDIGAEKKYKWIRMIAKDSKTLGKYAVACSLTKEFIAPKLTEIKDHVFFLNCKDLTEAYLPKLKTIGDNVFKDKKKLKKLTISSEVNKIGKDAFKGCDSLEEVCVVEGKLSTQVERQIKDQCSHNLKFTTVSL